MSDLLARIRDAIDADIPKTGGIDAIGDHVENVLQGVKMLTQYSAGATWGTRKQCGVPMNDEEFAASRTLFLEICAKAYDKGRETAEKGEGLL